MKKEILCQHVELSLYKMSLHQELTVASFDPIKRNRIQNLINSGIDTER